MIGEGSKVSKEKINDMFDPNNFDTLHFQGAALLILLAVFAVAFMAFLFSVAVFHADIMFLYLLSPLGLGVFFMSNNALEDLVPPYIGRVPPAH